MRNTQILLPVARQQQTVTSWNLLNVPIYELMSAQKGKDTKRKEKLREWKPAQCKQTDTGELVLSRHRPFVSFAMRGGGCYRESFSGGEFRGAGFPATSEIRSSEELGRFLPSRLSAPLKD